VAVLGLGAALPSPSAPAVLQRRAAAFGSVQRAPRSQVVVPGGRLPEPPGANGYKPPPQDATPRSAFRIVSGDAPQLSEDGKLCSMASICSQEINANRDRITNAASPGPKPRSLSWPISGFECALRSALLARYPPTILRQLYSEGARLIHILIAPVCRERRGYGTKSRSTRLLPVRSRG
jgi:hypothetical protein